MNELIEWLEAEVEAQDRSGDNIRKIEKEAGIDHVSSTGHYQRAVAYRICLRRLRKAQNKMPTEWRQLLDYLYNEVDAINRSHVIDADNDFWRGHKKQIWQVALQISKILRERYPDHAEAWLADYSDARAARKRG